MSSKQLNFFFSNQDLEDLESYIQTKDWLILANFSKNEPIILESIFEQTKGWKFLVPKILLSQIKMLWIEQQNYYMIDVSNSPVVELSMPFFNVQKKILGRGRLYYDSLGICQNERKKKDALFLENAQNLFKWTKKNFPNEKIEGFSGFWISQRAKIWQEREGIFFEK